MTKSKKTASYERRQARYGYVFVAHWVIGLILFFAYPLISSVWYAFNDVTIDVGDISTKFVGLKYITKILREDPDYINQLRDSVLMLIYSLPIIIALSLILAVLLNTKFRGRTIVRALFFLPMIISSSVVMTVMEKPPISMPIMSSGAGGVGMIDYAGIVEKLEIPEIITPVILFLLSSTMNLVWNCGVQTILFLSGLQSIPASFYEVSNVEGANKWQEFWLITVPSLRHIISLVMVFTMIELFSSLDNPVVSRSYSLMYTQQFGESSSMLWFYFVIVVAVISLVYYLYQRLCVRKWE